ncbi:hypothetical protein COOONC_01116 [Cooperia oncophora]
MKVRECDTLLPVYALRELHEEGIKKSAISLIEATVSHPKMAAFFSQSHTLISSLQLLTRSPDPVLGNLARESLKTIMLGGRVPRNAPPPYARFKDRVNTLVLLTEKIFVI